MIRVFMLVWSFAIAQPDGSVEIQMIHSEHPYMTEDACRKDGDDMYKMSQQLVTDKEIVNFNGACFPLEFDTKDAKGTI